MPFRGRGTYTGSQNPDPVLILEKIRHFCSYRERSEKEVEMKLKTMKVPLAKTKSILNQLRDEGYISDERFARAFVRGKWRVNHWGRIRIIFELRTKKIPEKLITTALEEISEDSYQTILKELIMKKAAELIQKHKEGNNYRKTLNFRDKIFNFALGKGYEFNLIHEILDELEI